jgi:hypothetical protein
LAQVAENRFPFSMVIRVLGGLESGMEVIIMYISAKNFLLKEWGCY